MQLMVESAAQVSIFVMLGLMVIAGALNWNICQRLQNAHFEVWRDLGEPGLFLTFDNQSRMRKFLWDDGYRELHDPRVDRLVSLLKKLATILTVVMIASFVLVAWSIFSP